MFKKLGESIGLKFIPSYSQLFRFIPISRLMKNGQKSIRLNPINSETSIRMNLNQFETKFTIQINPNSDWSKLNFQSESIRMHPRSEWLRLILIENSVWINPSSDWFGLIWIENFISDSFWFNRIDVTELIGLSRIDFWPFFIKQDTKRFSDWFGMIRICSNSDIGMNRNSSDWLGINFNPILSPGNASFPFHSRNSKKIITT